jgi:hypothetical protein
MAELRLFGRCERGHAFQRGRYRISYGSPLHSSAPNSVTRQTCRWRRRWQRGVSEPETPRPRLAAIERRQRQARNLQFDGAWDERVVAFRGSEHLYFSSVPNGACIHPYFSSAARHRTGVTLLAFIHGLMCCPPRARDIMNEADTRPKFWQASPSSSSRSQTPPAAAFKPLCHRYIYLWGVYWSRKINGRT